MSIDSGSQLGVLPPIREVFLVTGDAVLHAVSADQVGSAWDAPCALPEMSIGALAAHLARAVTQVEVYLDDDPPGTEVELVSAGDYFARILTPEDAADPGSAVNRGVRQRAEESASRGQAAIADEIGGCLDRLRKRFASEPAERAMTVAGGMAIRLDQYLLTRLVEMTVHLDDLAVSVEIPTPAVPQDAYVIAIGTLVQTSAVRHGSRMVLRALARRERDPSGILRVL